MIKTYLSFQHYIHLESLTRGDTFHCTKWSKLPAQLLVGTKSDKTPKPSILIIHMIPLPCQEHQLFFPTQCVFLEFYCLEKKQGTWWNVYVVFQSNKEVNNKSLARYIYNVYSQSFLWNCDKFYIFYSTKKMKTLS